MRTLRVMDGFSESAWKSVVVKSLRMGWPEGLRQAALRLPPSTVQHLLVCGIFEDVFPPESEIKQAYREARRLDYESLCRRETLHGRGMAEAYCDSDVPWSTFDEPPAVWAWPKARELELYLPQRMLGCFWSWLLIEPTDEGIERSLDERPWIGMLNVFLDAHCYEGRVRRVEDTLLSGSVEQHRALGRLVMIGGWEAVRVRAHAEGVAQPIAAAGPPKLF